MENTEVNIDTASNTKQRWFVLACASSKENKTADLLKQKVKAIGLENMITEILVPTQEKIVIKKGKKQTLEDRLFPGYILVRMEANDETVRLIKNTEGISGFIGMSAKAKYPTPLSEKEAESILAFTKIQQSPVFSAKFSIGDAVKIVEGPFKDFIGNVQEINENKGQVTVLLSIFDRETPVHFDFLQVHKI